MRTTYIVWLPLVVTLIEGKTWRRPTFAPYSVLVRGGGSSSDFLPSTTTTSPIDGSSNVRGGSTTTKKSSLSSSTSAAPTTINIQPGGSVSTTSSRGRKASSTTVVPFPSPHNTTETTTTMTAKALKKKAAADQKRHKKIARKLKNRNHTNLRRKVMHASFGFFFAALNHFIPKAKFVPGMTILTSATLLMELLRYRKGFAWMNDILHFVLGSSLRKHEMDGKFTGSFYYFLGVTVTAALYPTSCATLGICQLAIADPTASYFGRATRHVYWSRIENGLGGLGRNKGLLGFLGGAAACVPMNYELLSRARFTASPTRILMASALLGLAGAFADLAVPTPTLTLPKKVFGVGVPPFHVDDNFVVPVFSGFACTKIFAYLQFPAELQLAKFLVW